MHDVYTLRRDYFFFLVFQSVQNTSVYSLSCHSHGKSIEVVTSVPCLTIIPVWCLFAVQELKVEPNVQRSKSNNPFSSTVPRSTAVTKNELCVTKFGCGERQPGGTADSDKLTQPPPRPENIPQTHNLDYSNTFSYLQRA